MTFSHPYKANCTTSQGNKRGLGLTYQIKFRTAIFEISITNLQKQIVQQVFFDGDSPQNKCCLSPSTQCPQSELPNTAWIPPVTQGQWTKPFIIHPPLAQQYQEYKYMIYCCFYCMCRCVRKGFVINVFQTIEGIY